MITTTSSTRSIYKGERAKKSIIPTSKSNWINIGCRISGYHFFCRRSSFVMKTKYHIFQNTTPSDIQERIKYYLELSSFDDLVDDAIQCQTFYHFNVMINRNCSLFCIFRTVYLTFSSLTEVRESVDVAKTSVALPWTCLSFSSATLLQTWWIR